jgi:hypothetical protein
VQQESDRVGQGTNDRRHDDTRRDGHDMPWVIRDSIQPGVSCPEIILVAVMADGSCLLLAYPQGEPAAFVVGKDASPLRRELTAAFGGTELAPSSRQSEAL